jgi:hypothetical protein
MEKTVPKAANTMLSLDLALGFVALGRPKRRHSDRQARHGRPWQPTCANTCSAR